MQISNLIRNEALNKFANQMNEWGIMMPAVEPLIMDFGLKEFYRVGLIEYWIANEVEQGYCGKYLFLFDKQQCPFHSHNIKHETFFVVRGRIKMEVHNEEKMMNAGDVLVIPPGNLHSFTGIGNSLILELSTPCVVADNCFENSTTASWLRASIE